AARGHWRARSRSRAAAHSRSNDTATRAALPRPARRGACREAAGTCPRCAIIAATLLMRRLNAPARSGLFPVSPSMLLYRRLLSDVRPYWWAFALAVVGMVIVAAGDVLMAYMVMPIVQKLQHPDPETTLQLPLAVVGVFLLRGLGSFFSEYGMAWTG